MKYEIENIYSLKILKSINIIQEGLYGEMYLKCDQVIKCIRIYKYFFPHMHQPQPLFKSIISICVHVSVV